MFVTSVFALGFHGVAEGAESIRGLIRLEAQGAERHLVLTNESRLIRLLPTNPSAAADLRHLGDGDLLVAQGNFVSSELAKVDAVESVGLHDLLGRWRTSDWKIFEFQDFHRLVMYTAPKGRSPRLSDLRRYKYFLAPDRGSSFSIFLSDDRNVHVGTLKFADGKVNITVLNTETLGVAENISLSPILVK